MAFKTQQDHLFMVKSKIKPGINNPKGKKSSVMKARGRVLHIKPNKKKGN